MQKKEKQQEETIDIDMLSLFLQQTVAVIKIKSGFNEQADHVAKNLRESDYKEVYRSSGKYPRKIINISWDISSLKWIIFFEKEPVALFGVVDGENKTGIPWMVATDKFHNPIMERFFIRNCGKYINEMFGFGDYLMLMNCVDAENEKSRCWLGWCGFTFEETFNHGPFNMPFIRFSMARSVH